MTIGVRVYVTSSKASVGGAAGSDEAQGVRGEMRPISSVRPLTNQMDPSVGCTWGEGVVRIPGRMPGARVLHASVFVFLSYVQSL